MYKFELVRYTVESGSLGLAQYTNGLFQILINTLSNIKGKIKWGFWGSIHRFYKSQNFVCFKK